MAYLGGSKSYIDEEWAVWENSGASVCQAMITCAICGFTLLSTYDIVTDRYDNSALDDVELGEYAASTLMCC